MADFLMPSLGADMEVGTVLQWLVKPGDAVKRGDIVAVVDTEKATIEVEIFQTGVIQKIVVPEGEKVPVGTLLAVLATDGEVVAAAPEAKPKPVAARAASVPAPAAADSTCCLPRCCWRSRCRRSLPRLIACISLRSRCALRWNSRSISRPSRAPAPTVRSPRPMSSAPRRLRRRQLPRLGLLRASKLPAPCGAARNLLSHRSIVSATMRKVIAAAMARSKREIPHYYLGNQIDMSKAMAWLQAENLKRPVTERLLYSVLLLKAVALADS